MYTKTNKKGFTTVELVIVIAVIAILAAALIPTFAGLIAKANHSADVQTAKNLTTQIMMYAAENEINDEADLRAAIDAAFGEGYYEKSLTPKSTKKGYCYWYDYKNCQIVLGTIEEMVEMIPAPTEQGITMANGLAGNPNFAAGNLRSMIVPGYFLISNGNNELINLIHSLENATPETYGDTLVKLEKLPEKYADNALVKPVMDSFVTSAKQTPILNENGLFTTTTNINKVYIPYGVDELRSTVVHLTTVADGKAETTTKTTEDLTVDPNLKLTVPNGTRVASNVLDLKRNNDNGLCNGSNEIHMDIEESQLGEYFFADVTDAVIVLPDGSRYVQVDTNFMKLSSNGSTSVDGVASPAYGELKSFFIGFAANDSAAAGKAYIKDVLQSEFAYDLYISEDLRSSITLTASNFLGLIDGAESTLPVRNVTFSVNGTPVSHAGLTYTLTDFKDGDTISVKARDITYTFTVKITKVNAFTVESLNASTDRTVALLYNNGTSSWDIAFSIGFANMPADGIDLDQTVTMGSSGLFTFDGKKLTLIEGTSFAGEYEETLTFTCRGKKAQITVKLYDASLSAFAPNANLSSMPDGTFVIGSQGTTDGKNNLTLEDLFQLTDAGQKATVKAFELTISAAGVSIPLGEDWKTYDLQGALDQNLKGADTALTLTLKSHGSTKDAATVTVRFVHGAWNVSNEKEWAEYKTQNKTNTSVAVLNGFTVDANNDTPTAQKYTLNVGTGNVYGNLKVLSFENYIIKATYPYNYIINATGTSVIDNVIIVGPDYGNTICLNDDAAQSNGTYVTAVKVSKGATVQNSFLSGFRSPLHANGGTITVKNTTLHRGNYANIYVDAATNLVLDTVTTIQYNGKDGNIGSGIAYKHNAGKNQTLTATNLTQHNYVTVADIDSIIKSAAKVAGDNPLISMAATMLKLDEAKDLPLVAAVKHTGSEDLYHMGITVMTLPILSTAESQVPVLTINSCTDENGTAYATCSPVTKSFMGKAIASLQVIGKPTCTTCDHTAETLYAIPDGMTEAVYTMEILNEYLAAR